LVDLRKRGWEPKIVFARRTEEQQRDAIRRGASHTMLSWHVEHTIGLLPAGARLQVVRGNAVDIVDGRYGWGGKDESKDFQFWKDLGVSAHNHDCQWGGDWKPVRRRGKTGRCTSETSAMLRMCGCSLLRNPSKIRSQLELPEHKHSARGFPVGVSPAGIITTVAGDGNLGGSGDGEHCNPHRPLPPLKQWQPRVVVSTQLLINFNEQHTPCQDMCGYARRKAAPARPGAAPARLRRNLHAETSRCLLPVRCCAAASAMAMPILGAIVGLIRGSGLDIGIVLVYKGHQIWLGL